ncbi:sensor histidine kinase [Paenibacillus endoradicis]|uniref:sensor histidine kinase n=1 Tax=Paenibacillus endoradicis TaxID=2972487 RepID=UPI00215996E0|nr:ATP-binding protein [Paenibacillus endoradicis]MCR8658645.1 ATP-binding protein [Paenibacillus endoradicis]
MFTVELIFMIISVIMMGIIFFSLYRFRREPGVRYLMGLVVCRIIFAISVVLEKSSHLLVEKVIFRNFQQTGLIFIVPLFIVFVYELTGSRRVMQLYLKIALFSIFSLVALCIWLDTYLHVIYYSVQLYEDELVTTRTMVAKGFNLLCYSALATCMYILFKYLWSIRNEFRKPGILVLLLMSLPFMLEIIEFAKPQWASWLGVLSVFCGMTGTLILLIVLRFKFFSIVPIAKNIVFDTIQESILIINASGKVIDSNKKATQFFSEIGYYNIYGSTITQLLEQWPEWYNLCQTSQQGSVEIDVWTNGERKIYRVNIYPLRVFRNQSQGSVSLIFDITEKQGHLEKIAHLNELKDQLFTIVSHDIRSPLAMQYQLVEILEEDLDQFGAEHQEIIMKLGEQIRNTLGMSNNLLEWFRSQREDIGLRSQILELREVVEESCYLLHINSIAKHLNVHNNISVGTYINADREAVGLIIRNLLSNAIKFTPTGGSIHIEAQSSEDMVTIAVCDNGIGMNIDQLQQLFVTKQINSSTGTLGEKGAGLGLLVSKQFVQLSGGTMWVESEIGQGSSFYFTMRRGASL